MFRDFYIVPRAPRASDLGLDKVERSPLTLTLTQPSEAPQGAPKNPEKHLLTSIPIYSTISPFVIDDNSKAPPLNELPLITNLPLRACFLYLPYSSFSPPLASMEKGTSVMPMLSYCCVVEDRSIQLGDSMTLNFSLRYSKVSLGRGLVKMSATCSFVPIYSNLIFFYVTCS